MNELKPDSPEVDICRIKYVMEKTKEEKLQYFTFENCPGESEIHIFFLNDQLKQSLKKYDHLNKKIVEVEAQKIKEGKK